MASLDHIELIAEETSKDVCDFVICHYSDVILGAMAFQISRFFTQPFILALIKESIKYPRQWPLRGEFTGDRIKGK